MMIKIFKVAVIFLMTTFLISCGGGGSGDGTRLSGSPKAVLPTSYLNFKGVGLTPMNLPTFGNARAYADFSKTGNLDLFTADLTYSANNPIGQATPSIFKFWKVMSDGSYVEDTSKLTNNYGCIHPRKAIVADFNSDSVPDVFIACHGYDGVPFSGEKNKILLSQNNGTFLIQDALDVGYWHGATAFDVDNNGTIDLMLVSTTDPSRGVTYLNNGQGVFAKDEKNRFPSVINNKGYFSIEAIDVNADNKPDLVLGGHEYEGAVNLVLINPGDGNFSSVTSSVLPIVSNFGIVLDFVYTTSGSDRFLWTLRTQSSPFYAGYAVQKINLDNNTSALISSVTSGNWLTWLIATIIGGISYIATDKAQEGYAYPIN